ncbi:MAG: Crp/Fnr family transcriptional regulator [Pyrinomonadaceae bacterium]|jgi:CRP-like cAMP-binding protein|nr:Crp/Fnr family transcriptional regulator [Pyrinomonadaceae bacterium]
MREKLSQHFAEIISLTDEEFDYVFSHFKTKKLKKHQFLVQAGDIVPNEFFVVKGLIKAYQIDESGKEHIIKFAMENWWITDYQAFFNQSRATLYVDCVEDVEMLCLSLENREKLCSELHKIEHFFLQKTSSAYISMQRRILSLLNSNAKERYEQLLQQYPQLFQRVPKTLIASYLGVSRETLSRFA